MVTILYFQAFMKAVDKDSSGTIDLEEFVKAASSQ